MYVELSKKQKQQKLEFIKNYIKSNNAADGSKFDANANVTSKNIATLESEINKDINIQINRALVSSRIQEMFGEEMAKEYNRQIEEHEIYVHDETSLKPYCASISMYPLLLDGLCKLGGESKSPKHIESFCGTFVNMVFAISSQFAGAIATVEFLSYFDYFARKEYGDNYLKTHKEEISNHFQHVVYAINQPAAARGYQSVFWNISLYDEHYFNSLFEGFFFPDGQEPSWKSVSGLQDFFMSWFNKERENAILTFPVVTAAMLTENGEPKDNNFHTMCAKELSEGNSFFMYLSESADSLASCCRLRNEIQDNTFSYSLGAGGVTTGSVNVITMNLNRLVQKEISIKECTQKIHMYQMAYRSIMDDYLEAGLLTVYDAGFINLDKQFLTIGLNGLAESAEYLGIKVENSDEYQSYIQKQLKIIFNENKEAFSKYGKRFNTEFVPAENLGVKNAKWDKEDGLFVPRDCYNSYFYLVEDEASNTLDKINLHGEASMRFLDGGSALHLNLDESLSLESYKKLISTAARFGCNYFCINVKATICNDCENIDKRSLPHCSKCGSADVDYATRVIGYLKRVSSFSKQRNIEAKKRYYHRKLDGKTPRLDPSFESFSKL